MFISIENVFAWLLAYRYFVLFPIMVVEGPIITIIAGFLSSTGVLNPIIAYVVIVTGDVTGDCIYYALGRWGRVGFIDRWGHKMGMSHERIQKLEQHFVKHAGKTLIMGKITHAIGSIILIAAGVARIPFWRFVWFNFLATLPKSLLLIFVGYYFGAAFMAFDKYLNIGTLVLIVFFGILILSYFLMKKLGRKLDDDLTQ